MMDRQRQLAYHLVAVDVDGTLLNSKGRISDGAAEAFAEARSRGVRVTLVTGRAKVSLLHVLAALQLDQPYIAAQGAYVADPVSGEVIDYQTLSQEDTGAIVRIARDLDASVF